ncbi:hypothetical protein M8C21_024594 [Ambrosia artemisiifolia]|uniref:Uncharacterized protein n=1 Tax=Ambrosia artemisiifolia TaxID=4212 RepID=A0AAD5GTQ2_AMBAR|nr:hypothetical protein M8C21_024594 [Ambrosia artemisiifolia]
MHLQSEREGVMSGLTFRRLVQRC